MVTLKHLKDVAKREDLKMLLRYRLPKMVYEEMIGSGATRSLLDDDIPEMSQQPLKPTQYVPPAK